MCVWMIRLGNKTQYIRNLLVAFHAQSKGAHVTNISGNKTFMQNTIITVYSARKILLKVEVANTEIFIYCEF